MAVGIKLSAHLSLLGLTAVFHASKEALLQHDGMGEKRLWKGGMLDHSEQSLARLHTAWRHCHLKMHVLYASALWELASVALDCNAWVNMTLCWPIVLTT